MTTSGRWLGLCIRAVARGVGECLALYVLLLTEACLCACVVLHSDKALLFAEEHSESKLKLGGFPLIPLEIHGKSALHAKLKMLKNIVEAEVGGGSLEWQRARKTVPQLNDRDRESARLGTASSVATREGDDADEDATDGFGQGQHQETKQNSEEDARWVGGAARSLSSEGGLDEPSLFQPSTTLSQHSAGLEERSGTMEQASFSIMEGSLLDGDQSQMDTGTSASVPESTKPFTGTRAERKRRRRLGLPIEELEQLSTLERVRRHIDDMPADHRYVTSMEKRKLRREASLPSRPATGLIGEAEDTEVLASLAGTDAAFLAPERLAQGLPGPGSDMWSLGCLAFKLATGADPHLATCTFEDVIQRIPLRHQPMLFPLLRTLLQRDPNDRASAAQVVRYLRSVNNRSTSERGDVKHLPSNALPPTSQLKPGTLVAIPKPTQLNPIEDRQREKDEDKAWLAGADAERRMKESMRRHAKSQDPLHGYHGPRPLSAVPPQYDDPQRAAMAEAAAEAARKASASVADQLNKRRAGAELTPFQRAMQESAKVAVHTPILTANAAGRTGDTPLTTARSTDSDRPSSAKELLDRSLAAQAKLAAPRSEYPGPVLGSARSAGNTDVFSDQVLSDTSRFKLTTPASSAARGGILMSPLLRKAVADPDRNISVIDNPLTPLYHAAPSPRMTTPAPVGALPLHRTAATPSYTGQPLSPASARTPQPPRSADPGSRARTAGSLASTWLPPVSEREGDDEDEWGLDDDEPDGGMGDGVHEDSAETVESANPLTPLFHPARLTRAPDEAWLAQSHATDDRPASASSAFMGFE